MSDLLYMMTFSGKKFYPKKPTPNEVDINDIARSLSMMNRFCGHTKFPYSVARHSINCANIAPEGYKLEALLHDATEAYLSDIVMPAKRSLPEYEIMENDFSVRLEMVYTIFYKHFRITVFWQIGCGNAVKP